MGWLHRWWQTEIVHGAQGAAPPGAHRLRRYLRDDPDRHSADPGRTGPLPQRQQWRRAPAPLDPGYRLARDGGLLRRGRRRAVAGQLHRSGAGRDRGLASARRVRDDLPPPRCLLVPRGAAVGLCRHAVRSLSRAGHRRALPPRSALGSGRCGDVCAWPCDARAGCSFGLRGGDGVLKGKYPTALLGIFLSPLAWAGAVRLARPRSPWARRFIRAPTSRGPQPARPSSTSGGARYCGGPTSSAVARRSPTQPLVRGGAEAVTSRAKTRARLGRSRSARADQLPWRARISTSSTACASRARSSSVTGTHGVTGTALRSASMVTKTVRQ